MAPRNGFAALVKQRVEGGSKRRKLDDYETPPDKTEYLLREVAFPGNILEPACGSGRMSDVLKAGGYKVTGTDIKTGSDFLRRSAKWPGSIVTNPPYRDNLAEKFTRHALRLADGRVAMLMESKFLFGQGRALGLYAEWKPDLIVLIPERILFIAGGKPIKSQFFNHVWLVWPDRETRLRGGYETRTVWAGRAA